MIPFSAPGWRPASMKRLLLTLALGSCLFTGCARHYVVSKPNGVKIYTTSKPKLVHGYYVFKDGSGKQVAVAQGDVLQIVPRSMANEPSSQFLPTDR